MVHSPPLLHIPDGFLSTPVALTGWAIAIVCIGYALVKTRGQLGDRQIPLMGVLAAFIFAAQALNFPVAGGTSGHLLGATLAAIILGPWAAVLIMTSVIALQAVLFQDGGLLALGFNIVNMGVLGALTGHLTYRVTRRMLGERRPGLIVAGALGAWISVELGALATALQLSLSGASPLAIAFPTMAGVHALIGIGEALITVGALVFISGTRPDLLRMGETAPGKRSASWVGVGLAIALALTLLTPFASPDPDGLERVAQDSGFLDAAQDPAYTILPDYTIPFIENPTLTTIVAVATGTLLVFGIAYLVGRINSRKMIT
ncbi:MAG TPA: energy-coupling factor ABC transporter permease [Anaerolineae bacterium]|nr:energy-coupling factor ABC transporter permease [Anaerolineae bacterium]